MSAAFFIPNPLNELPHVCPKIHAMIPRFVLLTTVAVALTVPAFAADPVAVSVGQLDDLLVDREMRAPAAVIAANEAAVTSQVTALIDRVLKDVGDQVDKGELLIQLDNDNARLELAQARASLAAAKAQIDEANVRLENAEELLEKNFISDEELLARQAAVAVLEANRAGAQVAVNRAELNLARTRIRAPFAASIIQRQAQVGSYAQPGTPLITLVQTDGREIDAELDPRHASQLSADQDFQFVSQGSEWPVRLVRVSDVIEPGARVVRARFVFEGEEARIGASGQLVWNAMSGVLPVQLIVQRGNALGVFVAEADKARFVPIPGAQQGRPANVTLPPNTRIIVRGQAQLQDGDPISVAAR